MRFLARPSALSEIVQLREEYRAEMNCQIVYDSVHERPGWAREYALELTDRLIGYGSIAIGGPWREAPNLFEFYIQPQYRNRLFEAFEDFLTVAEAKAVETQTNDKVLSLMLHTYASEIETGAIVFEDRFESSYAPAGAMVRKATPEDVEALERLELDTGAGWVLTVEQAVAGAGGVLYHYNRPYGDIYMKVGAPFRKKGLGSYLVQELKAACRRDGSVPAARCNVKNEASRRTLQSAGFIPCGNLVSGKLRSPQMPR